MESISSLHSLWHLVIILVGTFDVVWSQTPTINYKDNKCDWSKCLSPQLTDATKTEDKHNICRLLIPSLHCMQVKLPACRRLMGKEHQMYQVFEKELRILHLEYSEKCHAIYTTCKEFSKCLRPEMQEASHHQDIRSLCQIAPIVISCFENAIQTCQAKSGYNDVNFELIENKLDKLRLQSSARCLGVSYVMTTSFSPLLYIIMAVLVSILHTCLD